MESVGDTTHALLSPGLGGDECEREPANLKKALCMVMTSQKARATQLPSGIYMIGSKEYLAIKP